MDAGRRRMGIALSPPANGPRRARQRPSRHVAIYQSRARLKRHGQPGAVQRLPDGPSHKGGHMGCCKRSLKTPAKQRVFPAEIVAHAFKCSVGSAVASPKKYQASDRKCYCGSGRTVLCGRLATTELSFKPIAYLIKGTNDGRCTKKATARYPPAARSHGALTNKTALLEQGCPEPAELISLGCRLSVHVPKKVRPRQ
jgi:hypothetical protein